MAKKYQVDFYVDSTGYCPVKDYIHAQDTKTKRIIFQPIEYLMNEGLKIVDTNMYDRIDNELSELRKDKHRILFAKTENGFVLLFAFYKITPKTPKEYKVTAHENLDDYRKQRGSK